MLRVSESLVIFSVLSGRSSLTALSPSPVDDRTRVIFPLVKTFCEKCFKADEAVLASLSFQYGKLCHGLSGERPGELWPLTMYTMYNNPPLLNKVLLLMNYCMKHRLYYLSISINLILASNFILALHVYEFDTSPR